MRSPEIPQGRLLERSFLDGSTPVQVIFLLLSTLVSSSLLLRSPSVLAPGVGSAAVQSCPCSCIHPPLYQYQVIDAFSRKASSMPL